MRVVELIKESRAETGVRTDHTLSNNSKQRLMPISQQEGIAYFTIQQ